MKQAADVARYRANLQGEVDSAALYRAMAQSAEDPTQAELYHKLAAVEDAHAAFWQRRLQTLGAPLAVRPGWRTRVLIGLARRFGADFVLPVARSLEAMDQDSYDHQPESAQTAMPAQERSHVRLLGQLAQRPRPGWSGTTYARLEGRHGAGGGNALRAAVLGANDGLVSTLSLVMGVAGASADSHTILLTGVAGMLAGACSMAMGEWISVQSARELYQRQIAAEAEELQQVPAEERAELELIYRSKGFTEEEAHNIAERVMADPQTALATLAREELGVDPEAMAGSPWAAAATSFLIFIVGALLPVAPFVWLTGEQAVLASAGAGAGGLFLIGAAITLFTGRSAWWSGLRQLSIGLAAAGVTWGAGWLFGVALGG